MVAYGLGLTYTKGAAVTVGLYLIVKSSERVRDLAAQMRK